MLFLSALIAVALAAEVPYSVYPAAYPKTYDYVSISIDSINWSSGSQPIGNLNFFGVIETLLKQFG